MCDSAVTWTNGTQNATDWTNGSATTNPATNAGTPVGLLLAITSSGSGSVWEDASNNATDWVSNLCPSAGNLLLETSSAILLEDGDNVLLE